MIANVRFFSTYDFLNAILSPSIFVYFNENCIVIMAFVVSTESVTRK